MISTGGSETPSSIPSAASVRQVELASHRSLTPRGARIFVATVAATTFSIAGLFTVQGLWPVLPFAGLEIALLTWAVRASMRAGLEREIITITDEHVTIVHRCHDGERLAVFPRHWVKVKLHAPPTALHPSRLTFESHGRACEVGWFLTEAERRSLAVRLKQMVGEHVNRAQSS
jgi:uncharacterized membrane protein